MDKKKTGKILYYIVMIVLVLVFLVSAIMLIDYAVKSWKSRNTYNELQDLVNNNTPTTAAPTESGNETQGDEPTGETVPVETTSPLVSVTHPKTGEEVQVLRQYAQLYMLNPDLVGWISIEGTRVNYPVVQKKDRTDYYLYRDFYGNYDTHGCLYVREECDVVAPSDNLTIYGHRMKDGTMMGDIGYYEQKSFWEEHQLIRFDTLTEQQLYQIVYVFKTTASAGEGFQYHMFVNAGTESDFTSFTAACRRNALYETGLDAYYGDQLITLSTCEYSLENGRLVVVAKRIE